MQAFTGMQLQLHLDTGLINEFYPLLQQGVWLSVTTGCSVIELLNNQLGIAEDYVTDRITTLFLNGKAIDDAAASFVTDGATLALSSAMPGLVGSTMRRGGHLAAMRGEITYRQPETMSIGTGKVKIKLFNMLMKEVGPLLLERGVLLSGAELKTLLNQDSSSLRSQPDVALLNGLPLTGSELSEYLETNVALSGQVRVRVVWKN